MEPRLAQERPSNAGGLFAMLDGTPAHILTIAGLAITLFAPLIFSMRMASADSARAQLDQAEALVNLDVADWEKKNPRSSSSSFSSMTSDPSQPTESWDERRNKERERLEEQSNLINLRKEFLSAQAGAAGMTSHLVIGWIGRLLLLTGLLILTIQSDGLRQKILLVVLVVVMFSALSGINLGFQATGNVGGEPVRRIEMPDTPTRPDR
jgi:hypothetical protein